MKKNILRQWTNVVRLKRYDKWECHFRECPNYDLVGSEHGCRGTGGRGCLAGRTGGDGCLVLWDEVPE